MGIDVKDLPLHMQKQALRKLAEEDKARVMKCSGKHSYGNALNGDEKNSNGVALYCEGNAGNKYKAKKITLVLNDGTEHTFDSKHEAEVYSELALRERSGEISDLQIQVPFELIPRQIAPSGKTYRSCRYIADFVYKDSGGNTVVADAKGFRTKEYLLKRKMMLRKFGIEISEV